jgi:hypothetical protein
MTKRFVLALLFAASAGLVHAQPYFAAGQNLKPAGKVWTSVDNMSDEFEGTSLNATKWQSEPVGNGWSWDGHPPALFKASNVTVQGGKMQVTVGKLDEPVQKGGKAFTHQGAIVRSLNPGHVGAYFECKMKANKTVMSSTFWLMTKNDTNKKLERLFHSPRSRMGCAGLSPDGDRNVQLESDPG